MSQIGRRQTDAAPGAARRRLHNVRAPFAKRARLFLCVVLTGAVASVFFTARSTYGAEDWPAFLDALKARGYDDVALVYLKQLQASDAAPPELNDELDYKIGAAAFEAWASAPVATRDELASQARTALEKYLASSPDGASALEANMGLARLAIAAGDKALDAANKTGVPAETRDAKLLEARNSYSEARPYLDAALKLSSDKAKALQANENARVEALQKAQGAFLDALIRSATLQAQTARTFAPSSDDYKSGLAKARDAYDKVYTTYGQYAGAFKARFLEAECMRDLGDSDGALKILEELAVLPFEEQFYSVKTQSLLLFAEIAGEKNSPLLDMSLAQKYNAWKEGEKLPSEYYSSAEGLRIALLAARAVIRLEKTRQTDYNAFANAGKRTFVDQTDPLYKTMNVPEKKGAKGNTIVVYALKILSELAAGRGSTALEAQELMKDEIFEGLDVSKYSFVKKVEDFPSALDAAIRAAATFSQANSEYQNAAPSALADAKKARDDAGKDAIDAFRTAFDWGAKATRPDKKGRLKAEDLAAAQDELDKLYMKYALVCYSMERYEDSFAVGEYLARRRFECVDAPQAAIVAMRSLQSILVKARAEDASETTIAGAQAKLDEFSDYVVERWGEESDDSAVSTEVALIRLDAAVASGNAELARSLLAKIPETSKRRASAELRLGQAFWNEWSARNAEWIALRREGEADEQTLAAKKATLDELLEGARQSLYDGLERMLNSSAGVTENDYLAIYGTYLLAQVYERLGQPDETEKWLTHPVIGALTVVERATKAAVDGDGDANIPEFVDATFQTSVYALALGVAAADPARLEEAEKLMTTLEELASTSEDAVGKLTGVYIRLGKRLEDRMEALKEEAESGDEAKAAELNALARGFETFLKRVSERDQGNNYNSLRWVADTYLALGNGLKSSMSDPSKEALGYFSVAGKTYQTILKKIDADPSFAPGANARLAINVKMVECLRGAGQYQKAFETLKNTIKDNRENLDVQIEAARIFQDWGRKESKYYITAIVGAAPDSKGKNYVWGWNGIARRVAPSIDKDVRLKEVFYDAYLAKTRCRFLYLRRLKDKEEQIQQAKDAESDLERLYQTHPDLGGPAVFSKFDSAYKNFQKFRGEKNPRSLRETVSIDAADK